MGSDRHERLSPHPAEMETLLERVRLQQWSEQDFHLLERLLRLLLSLMRIISQKHASLARLKPLLFGVPAGSTVASATGRPYYCQHGPGDRPAGSPAERSWPPEQFRLFGCRSHPLSGSA